MDVVGDQPAARAARRRPRRPRGADAGTRWSYELLRARGNTIEGGTTEILKNIVAERVLGLPADALGERPQMNFDFTDDQHEIKRTARDLLTKRSTWEQVREAAEGGALRRRAVARAVRARLARASRSPRSTAARGSASSSSSILLEELGYALRRDAVPGRRALAGLAIQAAGSAEQQRSAGCPGLASGELRGALGARAGG